MARMSVHEIQNRAEACERLRTGIHMRMYYDQLLYDLTPFEWRQLRQRVPPKTATFTSNEPRVLADTIIEMLNEARLSFMAPRSQHGEDYLMAGRLAEKFFAGILAALDDEQTDHVSPSFREELTHYTALRGFAGPVLHVLHKNEMEETVARVEAWDPLNTFWGLAGRRLAWACHYQDFDEERMEEQYGPQIMSGVAPPGLMRKDPVWRVYDYYDGEDNYLIVGDRVVRQQTIWGSQGHVPVSIRPVGKPLTAWSRNGYRWDADFGQSVFGANRDLYPTVNAIMSVKLERFLRMVDPAVFVKSNSGAKVIPDETDSVFERGLRLRLSVADMQEVGVIEQPELPKDTMTLEASIMGMTQRGGVPHIVHGESNEVSSGYNTALLMSSANVRTGPRVKAIQAIYARMQRYLAMQLSSGYFDPMRVQGTLGTQGQFDEIIEPGAIANAPRLEFKLKVVNQAELAQRIGLAQAMVTPPGPGMEPFMSMNSARQLMEIDDPDHEEELVKMEHARRIVPLAQLTEALEIAQKAGNEHLAHAIMVTMLQMMQPGMPPILPREMVGGRGQGSGLGGGGGSGEGRMPALTTAEGGSPRGGQPNPSDESQLMGRPRAPGTP